MPGRGTTDAIFVLRQLIEKYNEGAKELYMIFVDLEKAFDRVPRSLIEWALRRKGVPETLVAAIMVMYNQVETVVQMEGEVSDSFMVKVGVHQGSILSPLLFNIVLDEIAKVINKEELMELVAALAAQLYCIFIYTINRYSLLLRADISVRSGMRTHAHRASLRR